MLLNNFVSNALKFMPKDKPPLIHIGAAVIQSPEPEQKPADPRSPQTFVRLWIQDNGIGIAQEHLDQIFGLFKRLHGKQAYPGTGLGLAIVKKGAERMGGRVGVASEVGQGSRFWVELPTP